jgi:predicted RNase H-like HicB family nuclease
MEITYWAVIEGESDNYGAFVPDVPGAVGAGESLEEAVKSLRESLTIVLADLHESRLELPAPTPKDQLDFSEFEPEEPYQVVEVALVRQGY